jgi:nucleoside-diphosphate-sugar epimerase
VTIFVAGASGVIGMRLVPMLVEGEAARRTLELLDAPSGVIVVTEADR